MTAAPKDGGTMSLAYDVSNRMTNATHPQGAEDYLYAPDNRRVWRNQGTRSCQSIDSNAIVGASPFEMPGEQVIFYSLGGQKMGVYCVGWLPDAFYGAITASEEHVYMGARLVGKRSYSQTYSSGQVSDFTADRLQSEGNGSNYYPYGESKAGAAGDDREGFATYTRDGGTGLDYADQRWYASGLGRFLTSDAYLASAQSKTPSSWNRSSYAVGEPIGTLDPRGMQVQGPGDFCPELLMDGGTTYNCDDGPLDPGGGPSLQTSQPSCEEKETQYLLTYLSTPNRKGPLADLALLMEIVRQSDAENIDDRSIIALAGVETTYGKNTVSDSAGRYSAWSNGVHCAILAGAGGGTLSMCQSVNPYTSYSQAATDVIDTLQRDDYKEFQTSQVVCTLYEGGNATVVSSRQGLLDTIYGQLNGNKANIRRSSCP